MDRLITTDDLNGIDEEKLLLIIDYKKTTLKRIITLLKVAVIK